MKYLLIILPILAVIGFSLMGTEPPVKVIDQANKSTASAAPSKPDSPVKATTIQSDPAKADAQPSLATTSSHLDQLSPEIKQAVKDKLLHSEPLEIKKDDKGRTVLKHNGRFTQIPVAVKKAYGTVSIKEYSHIPESQ